VSEAEHCASNDIHKVSGLINRCVMSPGVRLLRVSKELQVMATDWRHGFY